MRVTTIAAIGSLLVASSSAGCSGPAGGPAGELTDDVIHGENDLIPVALDGSNVPARYRRLLDAFGVIDIDGPEGRSHCTATYVGKGMMVTAGHCFEHFGVGERQVDHRQLPEGRCAVRWGVRGDSEGYLTSACTEIIHARMAHPGGDFAEIRISPPPRAALTFAKNFARPGATLTIFSHPRFRPLEWSQRCKWLPAPTLDNFTHDCDTEPGSSGATVLDDATLQIVGIHDGGSSAANYGTPAADDG